MAFGPVSVQIGQRAEVLIDGGFAPIRLLGDVERIHDDFFILHLDGGKAVVIDFSVVTSYYPMPGASATPGSRS